MSEVRKELPIAHSEIITVSNQWFEVFEELQREAEQNMEGAKKVQKQLEERALRAERQTRRTARA